MVSIHMDEKAKNWIRKNGGTVALYSFYPFHPTKQKGPVDVMVVNECPGAEEHEMVQMNIDGIYIYIHQDIQVRKMLRLHISGFGPFQHLCCSGIKRIRKKKAS